MSEGHFILRQQYFIQAITAPNGRSTHFLRRGYRRWPWFFVLFILLVAAQRHRLLPLGDNRKGFLCL